MIYNFFKKETFLYLVFGALTTLVDALVFLFFNNKINYILANCIAWFFSVLFAYLTNKAIVFKSKTSGKKETLKEVFSFFYFRVLSLIISNILIFALVEGLYFNEFLSKIIVSFLVVVLNYIFSKKWIFK